MRPGFFPMLTATDEHPRAFMGKKKILIVDDDAKFLLFLQTQLEHHGYSVCAAKDGSNLMELMRAEKPDLVMVDLLLPKIHGFELCRQIKQNPDFHATRVILMTSLYKSPRYEYEGRGHGADDFIRKPFEIDELLEKIRTFLPEEARPGQARSAEIRNADTAPAVASPPATRPAAAKPEETFSPGTPAPEPHLPGTRPAETRPTNPRAAETHPADTPPMGTLPLETHPPEARPVETRPASAGPKTLPPEVQAVLTDLQQKFARELPDKTAEIVAGWKRLLCEWDFSTTLEMMQRFHSLAGTGTTFGFPDVTRIARELEQIFLDRMDQLEPPSPELMEQITRRIRELREIALAEG